MIILGCEMGVPPFEETRIKIIPIRQAEMIAFVEIDI